MPSRLARGMVVDISLDPTIGPEVRQVRPCVIIQNDVGNQASSVLIVAAMTDAGHVRHPFPVDVFVPKGDGGLERDSVVLCNQLRTVDKARVGKTHGILSDKTMRKVDKALRISLGFDDAE